MVDFTPEEEARWKQRMKERDERKAREAAAPPKPVAKEAVPFKSKIGRGIAGALTKTADKAEDLRSKADYIGKQTGRITKAIKPKSKQKQAVPRQLRPFAYKSAKSLRRVAAPRAIYRPSAPVMYPQQQHDVWGEMLGGGSSGGSMDMIKEMTGQARKSGKRDVFKDFLG